MANFLWIYSYFRQTPFASKERHIGCYYGRGRRIYQVFALNSFFLYIATAPCTADVLTGVPVLDPSGFTAVGRFTTRSTPCTGLLIVANKEPTLIYKIGLICTHLIP